MKKEDRRFRVCGNKGECRETGTTGTRPGKRRFSAIIGVLCCAAILLALSGCAANSYEKKIAGTYESSIYGTLIFAKDGTMRTISDSAIGLGTFTADKEMIEFVSEDSAKKFPYTLSKDKLVIYEDSTSAGIVFKKIADGEKTAALNEKKVSSIEGLYLSSGRIFVFAEDGTYLCWKGSDLYGLHDAEHGEYTINDNLLTLRNDGNHWDVLYYTIELSDDSLILWDNTYESGWDSEENYFEHVEVTHSGTVYDDVTKQYQKQLEEYNAALALANTGHYENARSKFAFSSFLDSAEMAEDLANLDGQRVFDRSRMLSLGDRTSLDKDLAQLSKQCKMDIAIATVDSLGMNLTTDDAKRKTAKEYADALYKAKNLGQGDTRDGVLLLIVKDLEISQLPEGIAQECYFKDCYRHLYVAAYGKAERMLRDWELMSELSGFIADGSPDGNYQLLREQANWIAERTSRYYLHLYDKANYLSKNQQSALNEKLDQMSEKYGTELLIVTTKSLNGKSNDDYFYDTCGGVADCYDSMIAIFLYEEGNTIWWQWHTNNIEDRMLVDNLTDDLIGMKENGSSYYDCFIAFAEKGAEIALRGKTS